jgi:hypothetical protein
MNVKCIKKEGSNAAANKRVMRIIQTKVGVKTNAENITAEAIIYSPQT